jgi:predicted DsbA family dithiol-disulfide isomerase
VGLPEDEAREILTNRTFKQEVDGDWALARRSGITGVPSFVAGNYRVVGAQPYDVLADLVRTAQN